jgi:hypothetical protein
MVEIKDGKVFNPATKRWVLATGPKGKAIIAEARLREALGEVEPRRVVSPKERLLEKEIAEKDAKISPIKIEVSKTIKDRLKSVVEDTKDKIDMRKGVFYNSKEHSDMCLKNDFSKMPKPHVTVTGSSVYPIYKLVYTSPKSLDSPKFTLYTQAIPNLNEVKFETNNYSDELRKTVGIYNDPENLDINWVNKQQDYIRSLPKRDIFTLVGNCNHSHFWSNPFLRGTWNYVKHYKYECSLIASMYSRQYFFPVYFQMKYLIQNYDNDALENIASDKPTQSILQEIHKNKKMKDSEAYTKIMSCCTNFKEDFVISALILYCDDLERIIKASPPIMRPMTVFRGNREDIFKGSINKFYKNRGFVSTSFEAFYSKRYAGVQCCFHQIKLVKGVNAVIVSGLNPYQGENEIVLNNNAVYLIRKRNIKKIYMNGVKRICPDKNPQKVLTSEIVVVS